MTEITAALKIQIGQDLIEVTGPTAFVKEVFETFRDKALLPSKTPLLQQRLKEASSESLPKENDQEKSPKKKSAPTVGLIAVDVKGHGNVPDLSDFIADKIGDTKSASAQILGVVFIYYLTRLKGMPGVNAGHLRFCFKEVGARCPTNLTKLINNIVSRLGYIQRTSTSGEYAVNIAGENFVEHDLKAK